MIGCQCRLWCFAVLMSLSIAYSTAQERLPVVDAY